MKKDWFLIILVVLLAASFTPYSQLIHMLVCGKIICC
jgi:hypothetical protein